MKNYKSIKETVEKTIPAKYVGIAQKNYEPLPENLYYALMVEDDRDTMHVIGEINQNGTVIYLVGVEKTSGENGWYISKNYGKRSTSARGFSIIVEVKPEDLNKFCILD